MLDRFDNSSFLMVKMSEFYEVLQIQKQKAIWKQIKSSRCV